MKSSLWKTQNDLAETVRVASIKLLNEHLAGAIDLALQSKQAHWNVKGPKFASLHLLFDEVTECVDEIMDEFAERAVQLGGRACGTLQVVARESHLGVYPLDIDWGCDHVQALSGTVAQYGKSIRSAIGVAGSSGDASTADLFTQASRTMDKLLWKLEAHQCE